MKTALLFFLLAVAVSAAVEGSRGLIDDVYYQINHQCSKSPWLHWSMSCRCPEDNKPLSVEDCLLSRNNKSSRMFTKRRLSRRLVGRAANDEAPCVYLQCVSVGDGTLSCMRLICNDDTYSETVGVPMSQLHPQCDYYLCNPTGSYGQQLCMFVNCDDQGR